MPNNLVYPTAKKKKPITPEEQVSVEQVNQNNQNISNEQKAVQTDISQSMNSPEVAKALNEKAPQVTQGQLDDLQSKGVDVFSPKVLKQLSKQDVNAQDTINQSQELLTNALNQGEQTIQTTREDEQSRFVELLKTRQGREQLMREAEAKTGFFQYLTGNDSQQELIRTFMNTPLEEEAPAVFSKENLEASARSLGALGVSNYGVSIAEALKGIIGQKVALKSNIAKTTTSIQSLSEKAFKIAVGGGSLVAIPRLFASDTKKELGDLDSYGDKLNEYVKSGQMTTAEALREFNSLSYSIEKLASGVKNLENSNLSFLFNNKGLHTNIEETKANLEYQRRLLLNMIARGEVA